jgi:hypothetical protein
MLTARTTIDKPREPYATPTFDGWYDPDSTVFQAADDERTEDGLRGRLDDEDDARTPVLAGVGGPTTRR